MESIEILLDKYWKGETTLAEEKYLKAHFTGRVPATAARKDAQNSMGAYFAELEDRRQAKYRGPVPSGGLRINRQWLSLAATLVMGLTVALIGLNNGTSADEDPYLVDDPERAYQIMKTSLNLISTNMEDGFKHTANINKINKSKQIIEPLYKRTTTQNN